MLLHVAACEDPSPVKMAAHTVVSKATASSGLMDPFPIAAVEFPAASRASVRSRTHSSSLDPSFIATGGDKFEIAAVEADADGSYSVQGLTQTKIS